MSTKENTSKKLLAGLFAGFLAGFLVGILYAPSKGCETRKRVKRKATNLKESAEDKYFSISNEVKNKYQTVSSSVTDTANILKQNLDKNNVELLSIFSEVVRAVEAKLNDLK